ncbi:alpha/beta hydrolase [Halorussus salinisoli]|uniref:alpha/beta hydrolase n=1 Tax=Halorussus salinisoli TaxID=2558242 RepID=UPI00148527B8|nr:acyl-CoA thioester hydrolase/BAAT C-terminal domain-containing protein [Halorussus salinisoli]
MNRDAFVTGRDVDHDGVTGRLFEGFGPDPHHGVLVLHGSGGAGGYEEDYARLLAQHGYTAFCVEYFGAPGTPDSLERVSLSYFERAIEWLTERSNVASDRVGVVGFSRGGEAALLVGSHCQQVGAVVGYVSSGYAFPAPTWMAGIEEEGPAWLRDGEPVPYLPVEGVADVDMAGYDDVVTTDVDAAALAVERATPEELERAAIPVERTDGPVLVVSGDQDTVWPASDLSEVVVERLAAHGHPWPFRHLASPDAGHAIRVPYRFDGGDDPEAEHELGGTNAGNARAAADAWQTVLDYLERGLRNREGFA